MGAIMTYFGLNRGLSGLRSSGISILGLATVLYLASRFVETDRELVSRQTQELVSAVDKGDWKSFSALLDPQVGFYFYKGRDALTNGAKKTIESVQVRNITVGNISSMPEPGGYSVTFTATADIQMMPQRAPTNWKFIWAKATSGDGYLLYKIEKLPDPNFGTDHVMSRLQRP
jgi:hypothetical protein